MEPPASAQGKTRVQTGTDDAMVPSAGSAWPGYGTPEFSRRMQEHGRAWLRSRGRSAAALIALWDLTGGESLFQEAAEKFPSDPLVCIAMIHRSLAKQDRAAALQWTDRFIAAEPGNPEGWYLKASILKSAKDHRGAIAALEQAAGLRDRRNNHRHERFEAIRAIVAASGAGALDCVWALARSGEDNGLNRQSLYGIQRIIRGAIEEAKASGDSTRVLKMAGLGLAAARSIIDAPESTFFDKSTASDLERQVLERLSDDTAVGNPARTVAEWRREAAERDTELAVLRNHLNDVGTCLETAGEAVLQEYANRYFAAGEIETVKWVRTLGEGAK